VPRPPDALSPDDVSFLSGGRACVVATLDADGRPSTTLMTWVVARDERTLAACVDTRSRAYRNVAERGCVAIELLGDGRVLGLKGVAVVETESMVSAPFPAACVRIALDEVLDHGAPGVRFVGPSYSFEDGKEHRVDVERAVFAELRGA